MLLIIMLILPFLCSSQESIDLSYDSRQTQEERVLNRLNDIIKTSIVCKDTNAKGKKFLIIREEISKGETIKMDSLISCSANVYSAIANNEPVEYEIDFCDRLKFQEGLDKRYRNP